MKNFDHIIVGTGQATGTLLGKLIPTKSSIAVIEGGKIGGSCVNYGCTPTKTMVASAKALHQARRGEFYGFEAKPIINFERVVERMNEVRNASSNGLTDWIESTENVTLFRDYTSFTSDKTLKVGNDEIKGENIYLNVGTRPSLPPVAGIEEVNWMDSAKLLELTTLPKHLIVIGGGYIGVEFAQVFKRLGSEVSVIQRGKQLMPNEDKDVADSVLGVLQGEGIEVHLQTAAKSITEDSSIRLIVESEGKERLIKGSHLLVATGRMPNSDTLGLENTKIKTNKRGFIEVDDYCRTGVEGVFAVGDVNGYGAFTHTAVNDGEIVLDYLFGGSRKLSQRIPIHGLFTDPPLGRVGLSEKAALEKGHKLLKAIMPMGQISRAKEMGETQGFAKLLVDADTDLIVGAAIHGPGGDEIINMFAAIMHSNIPCEKYREVVLVHPTVSELMPYVLDSLKPVS
ncbi:MAG: mercuric reductase [Bacteroidota bacterium]